MKLFSKAKDGGPESHVTGFFLIEIKSLFSIVLLRFRRGSREAFHNHAFGALTFWLRGSVLEWLRDGRILYWSAGDAKYTPVNCFHRIEPLEGDAWALSFRGPWKRTWNEYIPSTCETVTLTHGRRVLARGASGE